MRRWLKYSVAGAAVLSAAATGAVAFLAATETGLHFVLREASDHVPGFSFESAQGTLLSPEITGLSYAAEGVAVRVGKAAYAFDLMAFLQGNRIVLHNVRLEQASVNVAESGESAPEAAPAEQTTHFEGLPVDVEVTGIALRDIAFHSGSLDLELQKADLAVSASDKTIRIAETALSGLAVTLPAQQKAPEATDWAALENTIRASGAASWLAVPEKLVLPVDVTLQNFTAQGVTVRQGKETLLAPSRFAADLSLTQTELSVRQLTADIPQMQLTVSGNAQTAGVWPVDLRASAVLSADGREQKTDVRVTGALREKLTARISTAGMAHARAEASGFLMKPELPFEAEVFLTAPFEQKISDKDAVKVTAFTVKAQGTVLNAGIKASVMGKASAGSAALSDVPFSGETILDTKGLRAITVRLLDAAAGEKGQHARIKARAQINASNGLRVSGSLTAVNLQAAKPLLPTELRLEGATDFSVFYRDGHWDAALKSMNFTGLVSGRALEAAGGLRAASDGTVSARNVTLRAGRNTMTADGSVAVAGKGALNLKVRIAAPDLSEVSPRLKGEARGTVAVSGTLGEPRLSADLTASGMRFNDLAIDRARLAGRFGSGGAADAVTLTVNGLRQGDYAVPEARLVLAGTPEKHTLRFSAREKTHGLALDGRLTGSWKTEAALWSGAAQSLSVKTPLGAWALTKAAPLTVSAASQQLKNACFAGGASARTGFCLTELTADKTALTVKADGIRIEPSDFAALFEQKPQITGTLSGRASLRQMFGENGEQTAEALFEAPRITARLQQKTSGKARNEGLTLTDTRLVLKADASAFTVSAQTHTAGSSRPVTLAVTADRRRNDTLSGRLSVQGLELKDLRALLPAETEVTGLLTADVGVSGSIRRPELTGEAAVTDLSVASPQMPFQMQPSRLTLSFAGTQSDAALELMTNQGKASAAAHLDWSDMDSPAADLTMTSERLRLDVSPDISVDVAPDLRVRARGETLAVTGRVAVPRARIAVNSLPEGAEGTSSDEVVIDRDEAEEKSDLASRVSADIALHFGEHVRINVFELKAGLKGDLHARQNQGIFSLDGRVSLDEGTFHAYGQDLRITKGLLIFAGPADNPTLEIEAVRNSETTEDDVTAGVQVTGTASAPKVELFSDPEMSDENKLSYLLTGHGLDNENDAAGSNAMTSALIGLGASQAGRVVGKIGEAAGIEGLTVDTAGRGTDSQVVLSGYVLPGLQVKYGMGIFDSLTTLTLRYRLLPKLYLQAVSGTGQSFDVLWRFEF